MNKFCCAVAALAAIAITIATPAAGQEAVAVGSGSYASFTPLSKGRTAEHGGDLSTLMQSKKLWVNERDGEPIPTNDWWTGLINAPFADALWSYPAMVHPSASGVTINYPSFWNDNGTEVKWNSGIEVRAKDFTATCAIAESWHDWDVEMLMPDASGSRSMLTTLVHGSPFTWVEFKGINNVKLQCSDVATTFFGEEANCLGVSIGEDFYGIYLPEGCDVSANGRTITLSRDGADIDYIVVALLPAEGYLDDFASFARNIPRDTRVTWNYNEQRGIISSSWSVDCTNLATGERGGATIQGFLPHAYKSASRQPQFDSFNYLTPRGTMKMARGREFTFDHSFSGMLPWYPHPSTLDSTDNPFNPAILDELVRRYATEGGFGDDTYWGGKGLVQMAFNMIFALQSGDDEMFEMSRGKLKTKMIDWLTYTPGEENVYFAFYPRWGGLVGQATSYDSDTFNDHHFHYGYYTLAGAMLCLVDKDFRDRYGDMLRLVAKDYANWDRADKRFPFLRTIDPWVGHSYAGGLGDQGNSNGNGQESSSEAMQGWGGVYLLGVALNDREMRDAGIFGWSTEARATREYWFDVDHVSHVDGNDGNFDYSLYQHPYNTNITCKGIGWWTWFSGDPLHMHGIQWMPVSPALDYMSWDKDFIAWAYNDMMNTPGWTHKWFEDGSAPNGDRLGMLADNDWGNVTLAYMQRALPAEAAAIFDEAYERGLGVAKAVSTGHISYYIIHSHLTYGDIDFNIHADIPTANAFLGADGEYTFVVYNPDDAERDVNFYRDGTRIKTVRVPQGKMVAIKENPRVEEIVICSENGKRFPASTTLKATVLDQYGATVDISGVVWTVIGGTEGSVTPDGVFAFAESVPDGTEVTVEAAVDGKSARLTLIKGEIPHVATLSVLPARYLVEKGSPLEFSLDAADQYGEPAEGDAMWRVNGIELSRPIIDTSKTGVYEVTATMGDVTASRKYFVTPRLPNMAVGCPAVASSEQNVGTLTSNVNDGDSSTRWGSVEADGEWVYIDLGHTCTLTRVNIDWEAAYASHYIIQVAPDGAPLEDFTGNYQGVVSTRKVVAENAWTTVKEVTGLSSKGIASHDIEATGRYVRVKALKRGTVYGVSIMEIEICGIPADLPADSLIGIDIQCDSESVDDVKTAAFSSIAYRLDGSVAPVAVEWSTDNGTITPAGLFTPARYGFANIVAVTPDGLSASRRIVVNETVKLSSLSVSPAEMKLAVGESAPFVVEGFDQFGGIFALGSDLEVSVVDSNGNPAAGLTVSPALDEVSALAKGRYLVNIKKGALTATLSVEVVDFNEINLALGQPVTVSSGNGAQSVTDGNVSTRWQAIPGGEQWVIIELDGLYSLSRFRLIWEAACASSYHIETSPDGETWFLTARNSAAPAAGALTQVLECDDVPARFVKVVADRLSDTAVTYGMSLFEVEVYGSSRASTADSSAPVILGCEATAAGNSISVAVNAADDSGIVLYKAVAHENAALNPASFTASYYGRSGEPVTLSFDNLVDDAHYTVDVTVFDGCMNSASTSVSAIAGHSEISGLNLALDRPVEVSSSENAGLSGRNAVDGSTATRWGSSFNDNEWIKVDLGAVYRVNLIRVITTDAAYAKKALWEASVDGTNWTSLGLRSMNEIGTDELTLSPGRPVRYFRYTGVERATGYGTSVAEIEIYGDAKMLSVASREGGDIKLEGVWDNALFDDIDHISVTSLDMTSVRDLPSSVTVANPNCFIFTRQPIETNGNQATISADGAGSSSVMLHEGYDFNTPVPVKAASATLCLESPAVSAAMIAPFTLSATDALELYTFAELTDVEARFAKVGQISAHTPFIFESAVPVNQISATNCIVSGTSGNTMHLPSASPFVGKYSGGDAQGLHIYDSAARSFSPAGAADRAKAFNAYLITGDYLPRAFAVCDPTSLELVGDASVNPVNVYNSMGILVRQGVPAATATRGLAPGFYIIGNSKIFVK